MSRTAFVSTGIRGAGLVAPLASAKDGAIPATHYRSRELIAGSVADGAPAALPGIPWGAYRKRPRMALTLAPVAPHVLCGLVETVDRTPITRAPVNLLATMGALLCKIVERGIGAYYHLVVSNLVTEECEQDIHEAFCEEGVDRWRESVIEITRRPRPNFHFPGSDESTLYVIYPKVCP